jgi:hypothetical protein
MRPRFAFLFLALALGAVSLPPSAEPVDKELRFKEYSVYMGASGGATFNLGGAAQVAGQSAGSILFENGDYFENIGRYHISIAPRASLMMQYRPSPKDAFSFGFSYDERVLVFDFRKLQAPTDLTYHSDFQYFEYSASYARNVGKRNGYLGIGWQYNQLIANNSRIIYDGDTYRSALSDSIDSQSINLFFGKHFATRGGALDARFSLYCDTNLMYPERYDGYVSWLMFLGASIDLAWLRGVF